MAAERIEMYAAEVASCAASMQKSKSEVISLNKWIIKHQHESVADGSKGKLLSIIQSQYKLVDKFEDLRQPVHQLIDDFLKLPEGKLVTAKGKQMGLKWLQSLDVDERECNPTNPVESTRRVIIADIDRDGVVTFLDKDKSEIIPITIQLESKKRNRLMKLIEDIGYIEAEITECSIIQLFDEENQVLVL